MGIVYYANYLVFFERGRTEYIRSLGWRYRDWESKRGLLLPASEAHCAYAAPARYDDLIAIKTRISELGGASVVFSYEIERDGKRLASGWTRHPFVNADWKPVRIPADIRSAIRPLVQP